MLGWLNDLRIARKVAIAPLIALLFLIGLGVLAGSAIKQIADSFDIIVSDNLPKVHWLTTTQNEMQATQTHIFRSLLWQSSNAPEENQARARQEVIDQLDYISELIAEGAELFQIPPIDTESLNISRDRPADVVADELAEAADSLPEEEAIRNLFWAVQLRTQQYVAAVDRVRSMQATVITAAVSFAGAANQTFENLTLALEKLESLVDRESIRQRDSVETNSTSALWGIAVACIVAVFVLGLISITVGNRISRPIQAIAQSMRLLAQGDTAITVDEDTRKDEVGAMALALRVFRDNAREVERLSAAERESREQAEEQRKESMRQLASQLDESVNSVVSEVRRSTDSLKAKAESMVATADETSTQSQTVANSSRQASANVDNVSQAAQRLAASIDQINSQVQDSARIAAGAVDEAEKTDETVKGLSAASHKIGDVVSLINDIAEQTNLLALNATIEAARAGDAGRGFAVVASEVKNLASQTAKATEEIGREIDGIKSATAEAVTAIQSIGDTVRAINGTLGEVALAVDQQREATADISRNGAEAASGTSNVNQEIDSVRNAATRTGELAGEVRTTSDHLADEFRQLNRTVEHLIEQMRAA